MVLTDVSVAVQRHIRRHAITRAVLNSFSIFADISLHLDIFAGNTLLGETAL